jgi:hypothetical protein
MSLAFPRTDNTAFQFTCLPVPPSSRMILRPTFLSIPNMYHSEQADQSPTGNDGYVGGISVPREKSIGRDAVSPVSGTTSGLPSPSTAQQAFPNYPRPRVPEAGHRPPRGRSTAEHRNLRYTLVSWLPEVLCCMLGFAAMIGIGYPGNARKLTVPADIIILGLADGQPPTKLTHHVTINSLIQFITSVAKVAFMVPIVSAMGQLKWLWFRDDTRPLTDFQLHDGGASGGLGSAKLTLTLRILFKS